MFAYLPIFIQLFEIFMFIRTFVDLLIFVQSILLVSIFKKCSFNHFHKNIYSFLHIHANIKYF